MFALTDQRVVVKKGILTKKERSVPLAQIQDATVRSQLWIGGVSLTTAGGIASAERLFPLTSSQAKTLADRILHEAHARRSAGFAQPVGAPVPPAPLDVAAQIERLGALRDQGLLTS